MVPHQGLLDGCRGRGGVREIGDRLVDVRDQDPVDPQHETVVAEVAQTCDGGSRVGPRIERRPQVERRVPVPHVGQRRVAEVDGVGVVDERSTADVPAVAHDARHPPRVGRLRGLTRPLEVRPFGFLANPRH